MEEGVAAKFIGLDMTDAETVFDRCLTAMKTVQQVSLEGTMRPRPLDAIERRKSVVHALVASNHTCVLLESKHILLEYIPERGHKGLRASITGTHARAQ